MSQKTVYEIPPLELIEKFMRTVAQAGLSNSGMVIDPMAGEDRADARYVRSAVLARLEGSIPPCWPACRLRTTRNTHDMHFWWSIPSGNIIVVDRMIYFGNGNWGVEPKGYEHISFPFKDFEIVVEETVVQSG